MRPAAAALPALLLALASPAAPRPTTPQEAPGTSDRYEVHLVTVEQGDRVWELFGHNALVILDREAGTAVAWNWGIFDFGEVDFIPRFLRGTMRYRMEGMDPDAMIRAYIADNRSIYAHEVRLTPAEARVLAEHLEWHSRPENRHYTYDYFRDNCSTRIRDALDLALGGALEARFAGRETPRSYRWHSRRLVQGTAWVDYGLSFLLGPRGDRPITEWEAMFVPMELARLLEDFRRTDAEGNAGPLLGPRTVLFEADRPATPAAPPTFPWWLPAVGFVAGGCIVLAGWRAAGGDPERPREPGGRGARILFGTAAGGWSLFSGALGCILVGAWFTDHHFIHWNLNVAHTNPLGVVLPVLLVAALTSRERAAGAWGRGAAGLAVTIAAFSLLAGIAESLAPVDQGNGETLALALPLNLALALAAVRLHRTHRRRPDGPSPDRGTAPTSGA